MARHLALGLLAILLLGVGACGGPEAEEARKDTAQMRYDIGYGAMADGNMSKSIAEFREAVSLDPQNPRFRHALGNAYLRNNQPELAIPELLKTVEIDPRHSAALNDLGVAYFTQKNWPAAIDAFRRALANPRNTNPERAYTNLGNIYHLQGQYEAAAAEFLNLIDVLPQSPDGYFLLGRTRLAQGKVGEARENLERAVKIEGGVAIFHLELGKAQLQMGRRTEARDSFRRALDLTPAGPEAEEARQLLRSVQ